MFQEVVTSSPGRIWLLGTSLGGVETHTVGRAGTVSTGTSSFNFVFDRYLFSNLPEKERVVLSGIASCRVAADVMLPSRVKTRNGLKVV